MSDSNFLILSCDGGGIRGLITAMFIQQLDKKLNFLDKIDLFAGSSTGGIIALGLASGIDISTLVDIYSATSNCSDIFSPYILPNSWDQDEQNDLNSIENTLSSIDNFLNKIKDIPEVKSLESDVQGLENDIESAKNALNELNNLFYAKYDNTAKISLESVLKEKLPNSSQTLASLTRKVMVATFQLFNSSGPYGGPSWQPITLDNLSNNTIESQNTTVLDAALCTSAAPLYFPPHNHPTYGYCVDGGVFANNPSTITLSRVINGGIAKLEDIKMLSIGTGINNNAIPSNYLSITDPLKYGATTWLHPKEVDGPQSRFATPAFPLLQIIMDSSSILDDSQAKMFLGDKQYYRVNLPLMTENIHLDSCSEIKTMESLVNKYLEQSEWTDAIDWIQTNFS